jgi:hypothetical protein
MAARTGERFLRGLVDGRESEALEPLVQDRDLEMALMEAAQQDAIAVGRCDRKESSHTGGNR